MLTRAAPQYAEIDLEDCLEAGIILRERPRAAPRPRGWSSTMIEAGRLAEIAHVTRLCQGRRKVRLGSWLEWPTDERAASPGHA